MSAAKVSKTNAARILEGLGIPFELHMAEVDESDLSAVTMAHKLGVDPACVFKTLVARGDKTGVLMACIPAAAELDLKALAAASATSTPRWFLLRMCAPSPATCAAAARPLGLKKPTPYIWTKAPFCTNISL